MNCRKIYQHTYDHIDILGIRQPYEYFVASNNKYMNKITFSLLLVLWVTSGFSQPVDKLIKEESVTRIIKTLAADDMMGRSAKHPEHIEKATAFIENEFKKIGLKNLSGLTTYRQEFKKEMIAPVSVDVSINGTAVVKENMVLASESTNINFARRPIPALPWLVGFPPSLRLPVVRRSAEVGNAEPLPLAICTPESGTGTCPLEPSIFCRPAPDIPEPVAARGADARVSPRV